MTESRSGRFVALAAAWAATILVAGCSGVGSGSAAAPVPTASAPSASAPSVSSPAVPAPSVAVAGEALSPEQARELQDAVDAGHQPWRLDPVAVARAFADGLPGWEGARVASTGPTTVEVTAPGRRDVMLLRLDQPVTQGPTGVWVVQGGTRRA